MKAWIALLLLAVMVAPVHADERISRYDIDVAIAADGALDITENITATVEGQQIRRGIYRDFPTRYKDRYGNNVIVDLQVLDVQRNGQPEPWFTEKRSNGVRINTGDDSFLPAPATHTFTIHYRTTRQLGFFADHDELYWNAIGTGWAFPIDASTVRVQLPEAVATAQMRPEAYTGREGTKGGSYRTELPEAGVAVWQLTAPLDSHEGFTIVLSFPKGIVTAPTSAQRASSFMRDNAGAAIALAGFALMIAFCIFEWRRVGRDPRKGIIIARYEPPEDHSPDALRYVMRMSYDMRCFSAAVLQLAVKHCLSIVRESRLLKDEWRLERDPAGAEPADAVQKSLVANLFHKGTSLILKRSNAKTLSSAVSKHRTMLEERMKPRYFRLNEWSVVKALAIGVVTFVSAFIAVHHTGGGQLFVVVLMLVAAVTLMVFVWLVRAPTPEGRKLMDEIEGLKLYMSVAERDELKGLQGPGAPPPLDAQRYEALLPYAVALEVEEAWTAKFTLAVGAAAAAVAANNISWYRGGHIGDLGSFSQAIGSNLSSHIASAASPPGSSSGAGGGGSVGGGGGGGGGGGR